MLKMTKPLLALVLITAKLCEVHGYAQVPSHLRAGAAESLLSLEDRAQQHQKPSTTVTSSKNWFERMRDSFGEALFGIVLMTFSVPVLWFNEKRSAKMESLIAVGQGECKSISPDKVDTNMRGELVHVSGGRTKAKASVSDKQFKGAEIKTGCVRLSSDVEVYQWIETSKSEEKEKLGGGKETVTTYSYHKDWSSSKNNSESFEVSDKQNTFPDLTLGYRVTNCTNVEYGEAFVLTEALVDQCSNFQPASKLLPSELTGADLAFRVHTDNHFYARPAHVWSKATQSDQVASNPEVGDTRVLFKYVPEGEATIMALQDDQDNGGKDTFLPYRLISRGCCGISSDQKKARLLEQGRRSDEDLAAAETCTAGPLGCLCCACNLVAGCCAGVFHVEIHHLYEEKQSKEACFSAITASNVMTTWLLRLLGWVMMFTGLYMFFSPLITFLAVIPFLSKLGAAAIWVLCFVVTLAVAALIVGLAYLAYRPLLGMFWMFIVGLIIATPQIIAVMSKG